MMRYLVPLMALCLSACATSQVGFTPKGTAFAAHPDDHDVAIFLDAEKPEVAFSEIGRLDVHLEATSFVTYSLDEALERMKVKAREVGADGVIDVVEKRSRVLETSVYHVSATAIRYE